MSLFHGKTIVVPFDFSEEATGAIDAALQLAADPSDVHVVYVAPVLNAIEPGLVWEEINDASRAENLRQTFAKQFKDEKYAGLAFHVGFGEPADGVVEFAENAHAALIVMPSHGRKGLTRLLMGSVAERVVRLAHCPVLVLRDAKADD